MDFRSGDSMLSMSVIRSHAQDEETAQQYVFTITDGGFAKRTAIEEYRLQSRGGLGIKTMKQDDDRGNLVGGFIVIDGDEVLCVKQSGQVTRSAIDDHLRPTSRDTKGVKFVGVSNGDAVAQVARSVESRLEHNLEALTPEAAAAVAAAGGATIEPVDGVPPRPPSELGPDDALDAGDGEGGLDTTPETQTDAETEEP